MKPLPRSLTPLPNPSRAPRFRPFGADGVTALLGPTLPDADTWVEERNVPWERVACFGLEVGLLDSWERYTPRDLSGMLPVCVEGEGDGAVKAAGLVDGLAGGSECS